MAWREGARAGFSGDATHTASDAALLRFCPQANAELFCIIKARPAPKRWDRWGLRRRETPADTTILLTRARAEQRDQRMSAATKKKILKALVNSDMCMAEVSADLLTDKAFALECISLRGDYIRFVPHRDEGFVRDAILRDAWSFGYLDAPMKTPELMDLCDGGRQLASFRHDGKMTDTSREPMATRGADRCGARRRVNVIGRVS